MKILEMINGPDDVKNLTSPERHKLAEELREEIIATTLKNGGHLASNLGSIELTVALLSVFSPPHDNIVFDVGHQCYAYKLLTGRREKFGTIRRKDGISGFPKSGESEYDVLTGGHASASVSGALGLITASRIMGGSKKVVCVIGDGAMTGGLSYEGINNISSKDKGLIIILNDNEMSISDSVGAFSKHLSMIRSSEEYSKTKDGVKNILGKLPLGGSIGKVLSGSKDAIKKVIYKNTYFDDMGLNYYGPVDGHNIDDLCKMFSRVKKLNEPCLVHVITKKGKGFAPAEASPEKYHGVSPNSSDSSFSAVFGEEMCSIAEKDPSVVAITAAMESGTGLSEFKKKFRSRFFDVGIAEEHAATFSAGLAVGGVKPVAAIYSSFILRSADEIVNDCAIEKKHVVFAVDRAGFVGEDGETHQGLMDVPMFLSIPGAVVYAPSNYKELRYMLREAVFKNDGVVEVRYPKGEESTEISDYEPTGEDFDIISRDSDNIIVCYGRVFAEAYVFSGQIRTNIMKINKLSEYKRCVDSLMKYKNIYFFEEGMRSGGLSERIASLLAEKGYAGNICINAVPDEFVRQMTVSEAMSKYSLDKRAMFDLILKTGD